jgi:hypothetical protein
LTDVQGYQVAHGTSPTALTQQMVITGASANSATVTGLAAGTHYFSIKTVNSTGALSAATSVVSRIVP